MAEDPKPPKAPPGGREARLAAALRANLRRRKAPLAAEPAPSEPASEEDGGLPGDGGRS